MFEKVRLAHLWECFILFLRLNLNRRTYIDLIKIIKTLNVKVNYKKTHKTLNAAYPFSYPNSIP